MQYHNSCWPIHNYFKPLQLLRAVSYTIENICSFNSKSDILTDVQVVRKSKIFYTR